VRFAGRVPLLRGVSRMAEAADPRAGGCNPVRAVSAAPARGSEAICAAASETPPEPRAPLVVRPPFSSKNAGCRGSPGVIS
jgi:hypothetical protein